MKRAADRLGLDLERTLRLQTRRRSRSALPVDRPPTLRRLPSDFTIEAVKPCSSPSAARSRVVAAQHRRVSGPRAWAVRH